MPAAAPLTYTEPAGRWLLVATVLGSGIVLLDSTVVNVALPAIGRDLDAEVSGLQWTVNGYLLPLAALILLGGSLGDRHGRRKLFVVGLVWFAVASLLCALSTSTGVLVAARALQGVGGALLTPASLALIQATYRREDRARAIGAWSALGGIAAAVGPLVGGYLIDAWSWRAVFLINLPIAAVAVVIAVRTVPESRDDQAPGEPDVAGAVAGAVGLAGITFALIEAPGRGIGSPLVVAAAALGVAGLVAFMVVERRTAHPMLPTGLFASSQFTYANVVTFLVYAALGGVFFLLVVHLQASLGYSPLAAGAASLPITVLMLLLSARAGALAQRIGPRLPLTVGPLVMSAAMLLMTRIEPGAGYLGTVFPTVVVFGIGLSVTVAPVTATVLAAADERHSGVASGVNNAVARVAGLLAVAVLPWAAGITGDAYTDPERLTGGFQTAMVINAALCAAGALVALLGIDRSVLEAADETDSSRRGGTTGHGEAPKRYCPVDGPPRSPDP